MAKFVLYDQLVLVDDYDITGDTNAVALEYGAELKDCSVLQNDTRVNIGGLKTVQCSVSGFYDADTQDAELFANVGVSDKPISIINDGDNEGDIAYWFNAVGAEYTVGTSVGEIMPFSMVAGAQGSLIRGVMAHNARTSAETSSSNSTGVQVGAVGATQKLYAVLHVLESSGSGDQTLDVVIESDDNSGFTSATTRLTATQVTTSTTSELLEVAGAITDDYFRVNFTIAGTGSPSFKFVVLFGVQ